MTTLVADDILRPQIVIYQSVAGSGTTADATWTKTPGTTVPSLVIGDDFSMGANWRIVDNVGGTLHIKGWFHFTVGTDLEGIELALGLNGSDPTTASINHGSISTPVALSNVDFLAVDYRVTTAAGDYLEPMVISNASSTAVITILAGQLMARRIAL